MDLKKYEIPFNKPFLIGKELHYISQAILSGQISGDGIYTKKCHALLEKALNARKVLLTTSCTSALEMGAILCDLKPGDEVILPSYTFVSTANAFVLRGAKPVFVDIRQDTLNIDENKIENAITEKTKCIVPVHYAGIGCEMDKIMSIAKKNNLYLIEDAAQALNSKYKGDFLGTIGDIGTFSFHETKNFICGEGGAIIINNEKFIERAEIIREKGTNRTKFFKGLIDKYSWVDTGSSYLPSEVLAAFLFAQLENIEKITQRRKGIFEFYQENLSPLENKSLLKLPHIPDECENNYHMFYIILNSSIKRDELLDFLRSKGILSVFHYIPLHLSDYYKRVYKTTVSLPITEDLSARILRLPFYYELTQKDQEYIINQIFSFLNMKSPILL